MMETMKDAALLYAQHGWDVFPCEARSKQPIGTVCACGSDDCAEPGRKKAERADGHGGGKDAATLDPARIARWWARWPNANVAIVAPRDIVILDLDTVDGHAAGADGRQAFAGLEAQHGAVGATVRGLTPSGGVHVWLRLPEGVAHGNARGALPKGIDVRGGGAGYVMAPPSVHPNGGTYRWADGCAPWQVDTAGVPPWLLELLQPAKKPAQAAPRNQAPLIFEGGDEVARVRDALRYLSPDDREDWVRTGMALQGWGHPEGRAIWDQWSAQSPKFDAHDSDRVWASFGASDRGIGSLFHDAQTAGWSPREAPGRGRAVSRPARRVSGTGEAEEVPVVANFRAVVETDDDGKTQTVNYEVDQADIVEAMHAATGGWPRTAAGLLFVHRQAQPGRVPTEECIERLRDDSALFTWLRQHARIEWTSKETRADDGRLGARAPLRRTELLQAARMFAPVRYASAELLPHWPPVANTFYAGGDVPRGNGEALRAFVDLFNPDTDADRDLLEAALLTPGWGGAPGQRPGFLITSEHGVGVGKTSTVLAIADVWGGAIDIRPDADWAKNCERFLSDNALGKRVVCVDNVKGRLSSADIENAVTSGSINGKRMYHGDFERPNTLSWFFTINVAELSRDLADRCVVVQIGKPRHAVDFKAAVAEFLAERRYELLCDIITRLKAAPACEIQGENRDRFPAWQTGILSRFANGDELAALIKSRRPAVDADASEAQDVADALADLLRSRGHCPEHSAVLVPNRDLEAALHGVVEFKTPKGLKAKLRVLVQNRPLRHVTAVAQGPDSKKTRGADWAPRSGRMDGPRVVLRPNDANTICFACKDEEARRRSDVPGGSSDASDASDALANEPSYACARAGAQARTDGFVATTVRSVRSVRDDDPRPRLLEDEV